MLEQFAEPIFKTGGVGVSENVVISSGDLFLADFYVARGV